MRSLEATLADLLARIDYADKTANNLANQIMRLLPELTSIKEDKKREANAAERMAITFETTSYTINNRLSAIEGALGIIKKDIADTDLSAKNAAAEAKATREVTGRIHLAPPKEDKSDKHDVAKSLREWNAWTPGSQWRFIILLVVAVASVAIIGAVVKLVFVPLFTGHA